MYAGLLWTLMSSNGRHLGWTSRRCVTWEAIRKAIRVFKSRRHSKSEVFYRLRMFMSRGKGSWSVIVPLKSRLLNRDDFSAAHQMRVALAGLLWGTINVWQLAGSKWLGSQMQVSLSLAPSQAWQWQTVTARKIKRYAMRRFCYLDGTSQPDSPGIERPGDT